MRFTGAIAAVNAALDGMSYHRRPGSLGRTPCTLRRTTGQQRGGRRAERTPDTVAIWVRPLVVDTTGGRQRRGTSTGDLSLREAIELANANPGADEIAFAAALAGSTIGQVLAEADLLGLYTFEDEIPTRAATARTRSLSTPSLLHRAWREGPPSSMVTARISMFPLTSIRAWCLN